LLVTSSTPGYAMRAGADEVQSGMVLGKALEGFSDGSQGTIIALINLQ
jgi:hypothetical protein